MKKRNLAILALILIIPISLVSCGKKEKNIQENIIDNFDTYEVLEEKIIEKEKIKSLLIEDYQVESLEAKEGVLKVNVLADLKDEESVYKIGSYLSDYIKENNKEKLEEESIKNIEVLFKDESDKWLFDGSEKVKKIK